MYNIQQPSKTLIGDTVRVSYDIPLGYSTITLDTIKVRRNTPSYYSPVPIPIKTKSKDLQYKGIVISEFIEKYSMSCHIQVYDNRKKNFLTFSLLEKVEFGIRVVLIEKKQIIF